MVRKLFFKGEDGSTFRRNISHVNVVKLQNVNRTGTELFTDETVDPQCRGSMRERPRGGGGELPYEEYMGVCHELGSHFQEKIPKRVYQFFTKIPERAIQTVRNSR